MAEHKLIVMLQLKSSTKTTANDLFGSDVESDEAQPAASGAGTPSHNYILELIPNPVYTQCFKNRQSPLVIKVVRT